MARRRVSRRGLRLIRWLFPDPIRPVFTDPEKGVVGFPAWMRPVWRYAYLLVFLVEGVLLLRHDIGTPTSMFEWFLSVAMVPLMFWLVAWGPWWGIGLLLTLLVVSLVKEKAPRNRWLTSLGPGFLLVVIVLMGTGVARSVALKLNLDELNQVVSELEGGDRVRGRQVGMYLVDEAAIDERGGVYFRIRRGGNWGPGHYHPIEGLALSPNTEGSPFAGKEWSYRLKRVKGEWFWFTQRMLRRN